MAQREEEIFNCNLGQWNHKNSRKRKKTKTYIYLTCFLRELKERGSNSEAEQHSKDGKLQQLAWLAPHNPCNPILGQLPNRYPRSKWKSENKMKSITLYVQNKYCGDTQLALNQHIMKKLREICIHLMVWMIDFFFFFFKVDRKWKKQESSHIYNVIFLHTQIYCWLQLY